MKPDLQKYLLIAALLIFVGLPILFYALGDFPRRSVLPEAFSLATLLAFSLMLGQFFLARSNMKIIELFGLRRTKNVHTAIAYSAVAVILLHPFLIVLPRFFVAGVDPWDAFTTILTTFTSTGIVFGLIAWVLLLVLLLSAMFRIRLIRALHIDYPHWRHFHGMLSVTFTAFAIIHAVTLGRHMNIPMTVFYIVIALVGGTMLMRMYWPARASSGEPLQSTNPAGETS